jgi:hypothetical protein
MTINACLKLLYPLVKCDHQCLEQNATQNLKHRLKKLFWNLIFCSLEYSFHIAEEKISSALGPGREVEVDVVRSSGSSRPDIVSLSLRRVA